MSAPMTSGELFAGVGGLGLAVADVFPNVVPTWFAEFDPAPSKVLAHRYPDVPNFGDVTRVDFRKVPHTKIRCGGFPCTDVSLAGGRKGMKHGTRSGLWSEFARSIAEDRPDWVVIENVRGLYTADAAGDVEPCPWCLGDGAEQHTLRALDAVLADLSDLGFDAEWIGIRAAEIGAPHGRFRIFILAWPSERTVPDAHREGLGSFGRIDAGGRDADGRGRADAARPSLEPEAPMTLFPTPIVSDGSGGSKNIAESYFSPQMRDIAKLLPTPMVGSIAPSAHGQISGDFRSAMDHVVSEYTLLPTPSVAMADGGQTSRSGTRKDELLLGGIAAEVGATLLPTPTASEGEKGGPNQAYSAGGATLSGTVTHLADWGEYGPAVRLWESILGRPAPAPVRPDGKNGQDRLNPELTEWMMGWPAGWVTDPTIGLARNEQLRACGNGVVPQQAAAALRILLARPGVPSIEQEVAA